MYARRPVRPKPRQAQHKKWAAPVAGWVSNRALSDPESIEGPGAAVLDNFFPRSTGVVLRRGKAIYATFEDRTLPVTALFAYRNGSVELLFGANENTIYDLTDIPFPEDGVLATQNDEWFQANGYQAIGWASTIGHEVAEGYTGGDWSVVQFATTGGVFLVGVNGEDTGFLFDGSTFYPYQGEALTRLPFDGGTASFAGGETVTGGTSGAAGSVFRVEGNETAGVLLLSNVSGTFEDDEDITSAAGAAVVNGAGVVVMPGVDFGDLTSADMSFVWVYKNRLWFAQRDSLDVWYLDVDSIGGTATVFPMGGVFANGGAVLFGARWSLESGNQGGLSEQNVFVSNQGEVAIYQGDNPGEADTWSLVGVYRIGAPLGKRAYLRGGGDLAIATTVGLVPLSKAISLDVTALNTATVSYKIADAWSDAIRLRGTVGWQAMIWAEGKMAVIAPPDIIAASNPVVFVSNTETGAWARFTGWQALSMEVFRGRLFFGSTEGQVFIANASGQDYGRPYSGTVVPLFHDMGMAAAAKIGKVGRATTRAVAPINGKVSLLTDYNIILPAAPDAAAVAGSNAWGGAIWGQAVWGSENADLISYPWRSIGGIGYRIAPCYQVTSGAVQPLDVELIDMESLVTIAELVS